MAARTTWTSSSRSTSSFPASTRTVGRCKRSSSRNGSTTTEADVLDEEILRAIRASGDEPVPLESILDSVDFYQRVSLSYEELARGLRRAGEMGSIAEIPPWTYVDAAKSAQGRVPTELTRDAYDAAVVRHHEMFARNVASVTSSFPMRASTRLFEVAYRLTRGRFGLMPGVVDLDGVSLAFALGLEIKPLGWGCELAHRIDGVRRIEVVPFDDTDGSDRTAVVAAVTRVVRDGKRFRGAHLLVFPDGEEVQIQGG